MDQYLELIIFGAVCNSGIMVGSFLSLIAPEEVSYWKKTYEFLAKIIFLAITTITIHFLIKSLAIKILFYAALVIFLNLRIKTFLRILFCLLPLFLMLNLTIGKLSIAKYANSPLIFLNLLFFGLLESYFLIPKVFDKNKKYLKKNEMHLILKKTAKQYFLINLFWLILLLIFIFISVFYSIL
ncbi:MAG: hypothetical protein ACP5OZ_01000 [Candidatus Woesearchaeota archaeon]